MELLKLVLALVSFHAVSSIHLPLKENMHLNGRQASIDQLAAHDRARHAYRYNSTAKFPVHGSLTAKLFTIPVKLGTPGKQLTVQIETCSDYAWVACESCNTCPKSNKSTFFDPWHSSTAVRCEGSEDCYYDNEYADKSGYSGFYFQDKWHFNTHAIESNSSTFSQFSAPIRLGCTTNVKGDSLTDEYRTDGVFGFGMGKTSVLSQLSAMGVTSKVFAHCFSGGENGGGSFSIGEISAQKLIYSPLLSSQSQYSLNLKEIDIGGEQIEIRNNLSAEEPVLIDAGTTLLYFRRGIFRVILNKINEESAPFATRTPFKNDGKQCYKLKSKRTISNAFPKLTFVFEGNAPIILMPKEYLLRNDSTTNSSNSEIWCLGIQEAPENIFGDIGLREKIVEYDPVRMQIGLTGYNCSMPMTWSDHYSASGSGRVGPQLTTLMSLQLGLVALMVMD